MGEQQESARQPVVEWPLVQLVGQGLVVSRGDSTALCREELLAPEVHFRAVSAAADLVVQEQAKAWRLPAGR